MANIDDLNFGIHLDTKDFDARIQATLKSAKELNVSLTQMLDLQKKVKPVKINLTDIKKQGELERQNIRTKAEEERQNLRTEAAQRRYNKAVSDGNKSLKEANSLMKGRVGWMGQMQNQLIGATSIYAAQRVLREMVNITGEFEKQRMALRAIVQDVDGADGLYDKLQGLALESPFGFKELLSYSKQLSAFSVPLNELYDTTKMLADVSAGLGVSMDRIVLAYGQVRSAEFLRGTEVRQFTEAGIPILEELAKQFTELEGRAVSVGEVFDKISARQVPFEMVEKAFVDMTSAGGKFYQMQEVLAETLSGKISNLRDAYEKMFSEIGGAGDDVLKGLVDTTANLAKNWEQTGRVIISLIATYGAYRATLVATTAAQAAQTNVIAASVAGFRKLKRTLTLLFANNPYTIAITAATALVGVLLSMKNHEELVAEATEKYNDTLEENARLQKERLDKANEVASIAANEANSTELRRDALQKLIQAYPEIFKNYDSEYEALKNIKQIKEDIAKLEEDKSERALDDELATINSEIERLEALRKKALDRGTGTGLNRKNAALLDMYYGRRNEIYAERRQKKIDDYFGNLTGISNADLEKMIEERRQILQKMKLDNLDTADVASGVAGTFTSKEIEAQIKSLELELGNRLVDKGSSAKWVAEAKARYEAALKAYNDFVKSKSNELGEQEFREEANRLKAEMERLKGAYDSLLAVEPKGSKDNKNPFQSYIDDLQAYIDKYEVYKQLVDEGFDKDLAYTLGFGLNATDGVDIEKKIDEAFSQSLGKEIKLDYGLGSKTILDQITEIVGETEKLKDLQPIINDGEKQRLSYIEDEKEFAKEMLAPIQKNKDYDEQIADVRKKIADVQNNQFLTEEQQIQSIIALEDKELSLINEKADSLKKIQSIDLSDFWRGLTDVSVDNKLKDIWGYIDQLNQLQKLIDSGVGEKTFSKDSKLFKGLKITKEDARLFGLDENFITSLFGDNDELELTKANIKSIRTEIEKLNGVATDKSAIANFFRLLSQEGTGEGGKRTVEEIKNLKEAASGAIDEVSELGGAFGELINALDADIDISWLADVAAIAKDILSEDWIGLAIKVLSMIADTINGNKEAAEAAAQATRDYAQAMQELRDAQTLEGYTSIFGTDDLGEAIANYKIAQRELDEISNRILELKRNYELFVQMREKWQNGETEMFVMGSYQNGKWINDPYEGFDGKLTSDMRSDWHKFWGTKESDIYTTNLYDYFDEKGMLDGEALQEWFDSYGEGLSDENKVLVKELLDDWNQYNAAMENVASYMSDIFGQVADDIADKFITAFMETGNAAVEMGDIVGSVARQMAQSVVKSMLMEDILNDDNAKEIAQKIVNGEVDEGLALFDGLMEDVEEMAPAIQRFLESIDPYLRAGEEVESTEDLRNGIQSITEDTANLIASYINGIRADVSFSKTQRAQILAAVQGMASQIPSLSTYLNQIQANTYDIKMSSQAILDRLNSAWIDADLGGFKVYMIN